MRECFVSSKLGAGQLLLLLFLPEVNLGHHRDWCSPGTNIGEALTDAMSGKEKLPSTSCYSASP